MAIAKQLVERVPVISATSKGPVVNLVAWITMTTMCLAVCTVLLSKLVVVRKLRWNDMLLVAAMVFSIAFTIAINEQVSYGLGSPTRRLSDTRYNGFQQAGYASNFLFILGLYFGKVSTLTLIVALAPNKKYRMPAFAAGGFITIWTVASIFANAFQCSPPKTWAYTTGQCFDQTAFWTVFAIIDIITDLVIMGLPILLLYKLQLAFSKKVNVCFAFSFRMLAVGCAIFRIIELPKLFHRHQDIALNSWLPTIATVLELFFSVFAACVPHLRPFMESIQAGFVSGIEEGSSDGRMAYGKDSYLMGKMSRSKGGTNIMSSNVRSRADDRGSFELPRQGQKMDDRDSIGQAITTRDHQRNRSSDDNRSHDSTGSKAMIIKTTKEWTVRYEDERR